MKNKNLKINFRYLCGNIACLSVDNIDGEPVHNDINNEEAIIIFNSLVGEKENCQTVKTLLKENTRLEKLFAIAVEDSVKTTVEHNKLKDNYCNRTDCTGRIKNSKKYDSLQQKNETQQRKFIKYLNNCIKELEKESTNKFQNTINLGIRDITKEILEKYKERGVI